MIWNCRRVANVIGRLRIGVELMMMPRKRAQVDWIWRPMTQVETEWMRNGRYWMWRFRMGRVSDWMWRLGMVTDWIWRPRM